MEAGELEFFQSSYLTSVFQNLSLKNLAVFQDDTLLFACGEPSTSSAELPIAFENIIQGKLAYAPAHENQSLSGLAQVLAPLLAWKDISWKQKRELSQDLWKLKSENPSYDWVGIYRRDPNQASELVVSVYYGAPTPHERIPIERGICGAAIREEQSVYVPDVKQDSRFLACSLTTKSELVVPIYDKSGQAIAEIDIDCTEIDGFSPDKIEEVEALAKKLSRFF